MSNEEQVPVTLSLQREPFWDNVKALLIFLVVIGHTVQYYLLGSYGQNTLFKLIYLFHMPLFILVSGYFSSSCMQARAWRRLPAQLRHLGMPILTIIAAQLLYRSWQLGEVLSWTQTLGCLRGLWFLWVLLECWIVAMITFALPSRILRILLCVGAMFLGDYLPYGSFFISLWPFFLLGLLLRQLHFGVSKISSYYWLLALPLVILGLSIYRQEWSLYYASTVWDGQAVIDFFLRSVLALLASMCFLAICKCIPQLSRAGLLSQLGRSTLGIYVIQTYLFRSGLCHGCLARWGVGKDALFSPLLVGLGLTLICYMLYLLLRRIPLLRFALFGEMRKS